MLAPVELQRPEAPPPLDSSGFDWKHPDYAPVFQERTAKLLRLRANPEAIPALHVYYRDHPAQFINDWGVTVDPRNVERGLQAVVPFLLFPKQIEWIDWVMDHWYRGRPGITEKSRDSGLSWLTVAIGVTLCLFNRGLVIGYGSRKQEYVDDIGNPKALFWKAREFLRHLPSEFLSGWDIETDAPHMRILFPGTSSAMTGESGNGIGRGDRTSIYFVDEAAFLERPQLVDASLSNTTNCRLDVSTPNGLANSFAQRRHGGKIDVFTFHWRDDPRKGDAWYAKQQHDLDAVTIASEIDINYSGSVEGQLIPAPWIQAAIGAHIKLGIEPTGARRAGFDVADEGKDKNSMCFRHGFLITNVKTWSGQSSDIYKSVVKAIALCVDLGHDNFDYDADGLGSGVRGDARKINEDRTKEGLPVVRDSPFRGSGAVFDPEGEMVKKRKNKDFFANAKAQSWWHLRILFQNTYRAVVEGLLYDPDKIISIDPKLEELLPLTMELSQPTYSLNGVGKVLVDKQPDGVPSPNRADGVMIAYHPGRRSLEVWASLGK